MRFKSSNKKCKHLILKRMQIRRVSQNFAKKNKKIPWLKIGRVKLL